MDPGTSLRNLRPASSSHDPDVGLGGPRNRLLGLRVALEVYFTRAVSKNGPYRPQVHGAPLPHSCVWLPRRNALYPALSSLTRASPNFRIEYPILPAGEIMELDDINVVRFKCLQAGLHILENVLFRCRGRDIFVATYTLSRLPFNALATISSFLPPCIVAPCRHS